MSRKLDSPVQTQMAVSLLKNPLRDFNDANEVGPKTSINNRRRIFVETETGCVLGLELDRNDNAHTVKRKLQVALNFPAGETSLTIGDMVLNNDLTFTRNGSTLRSRNNLQRSSSTPCLSPLGADAQQRDQSGPIEILGHPDTFSVVKQMVRDITKAVKKGVDPLPVNGGLGGAYYFRNSRGESVAIVKPIDEEPFAPNNPKGFVGKALGQPGLKRSIRVGETGYREVAAYLLDKDHFANVPPTALVKIAHSVFNVNDGVKKKKVVSKIASFQQFIPHDFDASDHGTSSFPVSAVHRIGILDIRIFNTDRHAGNLLVRKLDGIGRFGQVDLIPIDHGLCLPETLDDPYFEWIHWPQASIPFSDDELEYIANLDPFGDCEMLQRELPTIREACLRVLALCTIFLKEAAAHGLCLAEIGEMMSREVRPGEEEPSELEAICLEARRLIGERDFLVASPRSDISGDAEFQFEIDYEEDIPDTDYTSKPQFPLGFIGQIRSPLSKLEETIEEEDEEDEEEDEEEEEEGVGCGIYIAPPLMKAEAATRKTIPTVTKLSMSLKSTVLGNRGENGASEHRSANEQLPTSTSSFVKMNDMKREEWMMFLDKFQELLDSAFARRKSVTLLQRQRLGTSCQF